MPYSGSESMHVRLRFLGFPLLLLISPNREHHISTQMMHKGERRLLGRQSDL